LVEDNHLTSFEVSGFKRFSDLKVSNIGQFNLIVGDNNTGKTSLLEALLVHKESSYFHNYLADILYHVKKFTNLSSHYFSYYFAEGKSIFQRQMIFKLERKALGFETIQYTQEGPINFSQHYLLNANPNPNDKGAQCRFDNTNENRNYEYSSPFIPYGPLYSHELTKIYGKEIQVYVDRKNDLINALSHIIPNIMNIEVSASHSYSPVLLIAEHNKNILSPLGTYGDGVLKLYRILLSLFASSDYNRLMIDEIDTGIHYSRLKSFFISLLKVAKEQKKQVFATTHSKECIESYRDALIELGYKDEGRIIRLADTKSGIKAYTLEFEEFQSALNADSEIR
jgi:AAA15 family ATPase/GTPase